MEKPTMLIFNKIESIILRTQLRRNELEHVELKVKTWWSNVKAWRPNYVVLTFEKSLMVATFLGGLTIGVLTFLFQIDEEKLPKVNAPLLSNSGDYKRMLIFVAGIAGALLILSVFAIKVVLVDRMRGNEPFAIGALWTYEAGFAILAILLPLLVYPYSKLGTGIISVIEIGWGITFVVYKISCRKHRFYRFDGY